MAPEAPRFGLCDSEAARATRGIGLSGRRRPLTLVCASPIMAVMPRSALLVPKLLLFCAILVLGGCHRVNGNDEANDGWRDGGGDIRAPSDTREPVTVSADSPRDSGLPDRVPMKVAMIDNRKGKWLVGSYSQTVDGVWIHQGEYEVLSTETDVAVVAEAILSALGRSRVGVPHPQDWSGHTRPLLEAAGVPSWRAYVNGTKSISITQEGDSISLTPMINKGAREGFGFQNERTVVVPATAAPDELGDELGDALERALAACR